MKTVPLTKADYDDLYQVYFITLINPLDIEEHPENASDLQKLIETHPGDLCVDNHPYDHVDTNKTTPMYLDAGFIELGNKCMYRRKTPFKLTPKEYEFLKSVVDHDEYGEEGNLDNQVWSFCVCGTRAKGATLGSLVRKGMMNQSGEGNPNDGKGGNASCSLTEKGIQAYLDKFGYEPYLNRNGDY